MKYLFCPLASHGFVYPAIGIARALRSRGHEVAFATAPAFGATIGQSGFERIPRGAKDGDSFEVGIWAHPLSAAMQVKHVEYALGRFVPDVLVASQLANGPLIVGERTGLPVAVVGLAAYLWPLWQEGGVAQTEIEKRLEWRYGDMMGHFNRARALFGLRPSEAGHLDTPLHGDLFMVQSVPALERDAGAFPTRVRCVGSCLWEPPVEADPDLAAWLEESVASGESVVYVQPGRSFERPGFWSQLIETLKNRPVRVVASIDRMDKQAGAIPSGWFVRGHVPQGQVLRYAHAVISSGHTASVIGALTHGLPSLLLPSGSGSEDIAERCVGAGAAIAVYDGQTSVPSLGAMCDELLQSESLRENAQRLQKAFMEYDGCETAAELLESMPSRAAHTPSLPVAARAAAQPEVLARPAQT